MAPVATREQALSGGKVRLGSFFPDLLVIATTSTAAWGARTICSFCGGSTGANNETPLTPAFHPLLLNARRI
jgi:hypothetical protein